MTPAPSTPSEARRTLDAQTPSEPARTTRILESLVQDHWRIRRALNALDVFTRQVVSTQQVDREALGKFAKYFETFADIHHAEKEERVLLPALERVAKWQEGPLAKARREHRQERYFMRVLQQFATRTDEWDLAATEQLVSELQSFIHSMHAHFNLEEEHVFPLVEHLTLAAQEKLKRDLDSFDHSLPSSGDAASMERLLEQLTHDFRF